MRRRVVGFVTNLRQLLTESSRSGKVTFSREAILAELALRGLACLGTQLRAASENCSVLWPEQRLRTMAEAYLAFAGNDSDYFRLLTAYDDGSLQQGIPPELHDELLAHSRRALAIVSSVVADGIELGAFRAGDPHQVAGVLWAMLNGALALVAHPVRRTPFPGGVEGFYQTAIDLFLRGITADSERPAGTA